MRTHVMALAASIALSGQAAWATDYTVENYDFPGAASSSVLGINAAGRVVGLFFIAGTPAGLRGTLGFTARNGVYTQVGDASLCRPAGRCLVTVSHINALGQFAGTYSADVDFPGAFVQTAQSAPAFVQPPGFPNTAILTLGGLNDLGEVAGCYSGPDAPSSEVAFTQIGGHFRSLTLPGVAAEISCVFGLNDLGQLTGTFASNSTSHGFILTGDHVQQLDIPAAWNSAGGVIQPQAINLFGQVIGTYYDQAGEIHGFLTNGVRYQKIDFPGAISTQPLAQNDLGDIVGSYDTPTASGGTTTQYFILRAGVYSTTTLPVSGAIVAGIDNFGRLFGSYETHGFVATPKAN